MEKRTKKKKEEEENATRAEVGNRKLGIRIIQLRK